MAGFAAATWLRGIDFVGLPTSLLAQVDSSVGGKTGVDIPQGKNLVGAFWPPRLVLADTGALSTLPSDILSDGMAEVVKAACIKDAPFFHWLLQQDALSDENLPETVYRAVDIKRRVVEADEREAGERRLLNFGHTLGHALEAQSHFRLSHGPGGGGGDDARHPRRRAEGADGTWYGGGYRRIAAPVRPARRRRNPARRIPPLRRPGQKTCRGFPLPCSAAPNRGWVYPSHSRGFPAGLCGRALSEMR